VSHLAGSGRVDVHRFHLQPGRNQHRPLHSGQSTDPIRQSHVSRARQTTHRRRLDSLVRHLLPAAYRLERRSRREIGCSRLQPHRTCQCVFTESHRYVNQLVSENLSKSLLTPTTMSKQHCRTKFCHFDKVETTS